ncbi:MAG: DUF4135 domain-containing protein [Ruminococcus sp.]|nr:DUF4135 domain-containing protein [Ruminococcus sp.]
MRACERIALGDQHFGKQVELVIDGTTKYLFKPRDARVEKALEAFLLALEQKGFPFVPACEHVFEEGTDWFKSELVRHLPANSKEDVKLFFNRCGALIFLTYLLHTNDLHNENVVACKNSPVIVDAETIMNGEAECYDDSKAKHLAATVTFSHLLPVIWIYQNESYLQMSGLYSNVTDNRNMLIFQDKPCFAYNYIDEITEGFIKSYEFAMAHRDFLNKAIECFEGCHFRIVMRPTEYYAKFIKVVKKFPEDKRYSVAEALLAVAYQKDTRQGRLEYMRKVLDKEIDAVVCSDIPHFTVCYESHDLFCGDENVRTDFLSRSPRECVLQKLKNLSVEDMESQKRIIKQSIDSVRPIENRVPTPSNDDQPIETVFNLLENGCIPAISSQWIMLDAAKNNNLYLQNVGFGLYNGLTGILCAYAAFYHKTHDPKYLTALFTHYRDFGKFIDSIERKIPLSNNSGCLQEGVGGILNALLHIYDLTNIKQFYDDAVRLAKSLSPVFDGECGDILGGAAGLALALPKLPEHISQPIAAALLPQLAEFTPELTGTAHGAAGVALAITAAQSTLKSVEFDEKIIELISFEEKYFDSDKNNWQDLRYTDKVAFMNGWCSGAGGIAMSRKRLLMLTENEKIRFLCRRDIERSIKNLASDTVMKRDSLCCGNSSRLMAASCIGVKNDMLYRLLTDRLKNDCLCLVHLNETCDHSFGLMQGLAGVGYTLAMYGDEKSGGMLL